MDLLTLVKSGLRITQDNRDFDDELIDLIDQCVQDLLASGVKPEAFTLYEEYGELEGNLWYFTDSLKDANIKRLIILYCKAFFGIENPDKQWFVDQYDKKKAEVLNQITQYGSDAVV